MAMRKSHIQEIVCDVLIQLLPKFLMHEVEIPLSILMEAEILRGWSTSGTDNESVVGAEA